MVAPPSTPPTATCVLAGRAARCPGGESADETDLTLVSWSPASHQRPLSGPAGPVSDQRPSGAVGRSDAAHAAGGVELYDPRRGRRAGVLVVGGVPSAAIGDDDDRHPLRDQVVKARYEFARGVAGHAARSGRHVGRLPPRSQTAATATWRFRTSPAGARGWPTSSAASRLPQSTAVRPDCWSPHLYFWKSAD